MSGSRSSASSTSSTAGASVFRVDRFVVPQAALPTFMEQVQRVDRMLGSQPGCLQSLVLTQAGEAGEFNVLTLVEWADAQAVAAAKAVMQEKYAQEGFDPSAFMRQLGVRADFGVYRGA